MKFHWFIIEENWKLRHLTKGILDESKEISEEKKFDKDSGKMHKFCYNFKKKKLLVSLSYLTNTWA